MRAPDDDAGQAGDVGFAGDQVADTAFVQAARVVDDQHVAGRRGGDRLEEHVRAPGMSRRAGAGPATR